VALGERARDERADGAAGADDQNFHVVSFKRIAAARLP
jgi:hypothetical protein